MRIAVFDYVPSMILHGVELPDDLDVVVFRDAGDPVASLHRMRPFPAAVYVAQPPGETRGYAVAAALRDAYPNLRVVGVRTADAHKAGFEAVGADAVVDPPGMNKDIAGVKKARAS